MITTSNIPDKFKKKMQDILRDEYISFWEQYENRNYQALRFNPLKKGFSAEKEMVCLSELYGAETEEYDAVPWAEHAFYYNESESVRPGKHFYHDIGLYYIQEPSAMSAAALLKPEPGERVLDLCAAPGGKSTQLASYMKQKGLLVSNEIHPARCKILAQNMERMGIENALVCNEDGEKLAKCFPEYFHKILVDAPCSGEGMFRKNPQAMEEWSPEHVKMCASRQREILEYAASMLMPGGTMVYSTCTFSPEENEQVIGSFLTAHEEFYLPCVDALWFVKGHPEWADGNPELEKTFRLWPHKLQGEGHFAAVLKKYGDLNASSETKSRKEKKGRSTEIGPDKSQRKRLTEFMTNVLREDTAQYLLSGKLILFGDQLYRLPEGAPSLHGLRILRAGLALGTFRKNRFEPSHALALWLGKYEAKNVCDLKSTEERTEAYFRGEAIEDDVKKGWCLVCVDDFSAGWGKSDGRTVKNHYPKGFRRN